jgi:transcriptional regulator with XRE-family HTH domain
MTRFIGLGDFLRSVREKSKKRQKDVAEGVGLGQQEISRLERLSTISLKLTREKIIDGYDLRTDQIQELDRILSSPQVEVRVDGVRVKNNDSSRMRLLEATTVGSFLQLPKDSQLRVLEMLKTYVAN